MSHDYLDLLIQQSGKKSKKSKKKQPQKKGPTYSAEQVVREAISLRGPQFQSVLMYALLAVKGKRHVETMLKKGIDNPLPASFKQGESYNFEKLNLLGHVIMHLEDIGLVSFPESTKTRINTEYSKMIGNAGSYFVIKSRHFDRIPKYRQKHLASRQKGLKISKREMASFLRALNTTSVSSTPSDPSCLIPTPSPFDGIDIDISTVHTSFKRHRAIHGKEETVPSFFKKEFDAVVGMMVSDKDRLAVANLALTVDSRKRFLAAVSGSGFKAGLEEASRVALDDYTQ
eukprot:gnl/Dysnectes_brevis/2064_a2385_2547.p1 GENE.gnl/Dysnectes_brevis/2064_a2385_2547~~gnl/Dysnectes_brevis/2064_a2385_2547.p1  ORF type:complete len:286 (-),score=34.93 gnl/Dysnectes_brevis/2064_a2385_2547:128-985(-)